MISLEMAQRLKTAGLKWEPKFGDYYIIPAVFDEGILQMMDIRQVMSYQKNPEEWEESINSFVFAPRLDQLLAEIEKRGYTWSLELTDEGKYVINIFKGAQGVCCKIADSPEEAAAEALSWVLEGGKSSEV